jgi:hypothetical protein
MPRTTPQSMPQGAYLKDISAHYNQFTIPLALRKFAPLPADVWGRLVVEDGTLKLYLDGGSQATTVTAESPALIPGGAEFMVDGTGSPVRFYVEYHHVPLLEDGAELASLLSRSPARKSGSRR